jgi:hypothetical protein
MSKVDKNSDEDMIRRFQTILAHFQHHYKNLGISGKLALVYMYVDEEKENKIKQAFYFGQFYQSVMSMTMPTTFIFLHKQIPIFSELPKELQNHIAELDQLLLNLQEFMDGPRNGPQEKDAGIAKKFTDMLLNDKEEEAKVMIETIHSFVRAFYSKLAELKKFKEVYA